MTPPTGVSGASVQFSASVNLTKDEYAPVQSVSLYIFKTSNRAAYQAACTNLPLTTTARLYSETETGGGTVSVYATAGDRWVYRSGMGYGPGPTLMRWDVKWDVPLQWFAGACQVEVRVTTTGGTSSRFSDSFPLIIQLLGSTNILPYTNGAGVFNVAVEVGSADGWAWVDIAKGVKALVRGQLVSEISIIQLTQPPPAPQRRRARR